ncbi:MAG: T9SS type A sorting domain-containing protein, partial [Bacteroidota bacterium]
QGNFVVQPGGKVTLVAGRKIIFKPGTKILNGASLEGYITATSGYCSSLAPFIASEEKKEALIPAAQPGSSVFKIYPNPTNGIISLEINETESVAGLSVTIYRITGEPILKKELNPRFHQSFDLSSQPAGIYIMQIAGNNLSEVVKIIKR